MQEYYNIFRKLRVFDVDLALKNIPGSNDGSYAVPLAALPISNVVSFGLAGDVRFEQHFLGLGSSVFGFDPSIDAIAGSPDAFSFMKRGFGIYNGTFDLGLDEVVTLLRIKGDKNLLKLDVEGSEYSGLYHSSHASLIEFAVIVAELHSLDHICIDDRRRLIDAVLTKLSLTHTLIHCKENNFLAPFKLTESLYIPPCIEVTYIRNDLISERKLRREVPQDLVFKNDNQKPYFGWIANKYMDVFERYK